MYTANEVECNLENILSFCSGADNIPPAGFPKEPSLVFDHAKAAILPTASTCDIALRLPTVHGREYWKFKECMLLGIKGHDGFGGV